MKQYRHVGDGGGPARAEWIANTEAALAAATATAIVGDDGGVDRGTGLCGLDSVMLHGQ